jgi:predicted urease superfamily metal-dependent hydrolase
MAEEAMLAGPSALPIARKLVECGKAVAVRTGRWHTILEVSNIEI